MPPATEIDPATGHVVTINESLHNNNGDGYANGAYTAADQLAILQGVEAEYAAFDTSSYDLIQFATDPSQIPASVGSDYETVYFNDTPIFNGQASPGGFSSEIDFRNLDLDTTMYVDVNGFLGNDPGQVADTDADFINLTITITAHELGHTLGLRHEDSIGPVGFGISDPPAITTYYPTYDGLVGAFTTMDNIMASPASVGSSLANAAFGRCDFRRTRRDQARLHLRRYGRRRNRSDPTHGTATARWSPQTGLAAGAVTTTDAINQANEAALIAILLPRSLRRWSRRRP